MIVSLQRVVDWLQGRDELPTPAGLEPAPPLPAAPVTALVGEPSATTPAPMPTPDPVIPDVSMQSSVPSASFSPATWRVLGASVAGTSHIARGGLPCQDAHAWRELENGCLVAAVADGAGSAGASEFGARAACDAAVLAVACRIAGATAVPDEDGWRTLLRETLTDSLAAVQRESVARQLPLRDFACTLIVAVIWPGGVAAIHVGDGGCVALEAGIVTPITVPDFSGGNLNETTFLTSKDAIANAAFHCRPTSALTHLAMFSDGLQMLALKYPASTPHPPFFDPMFRFIEMADNLATAHTQLESFLRSPRVTAKADDDLTLVLIHRQTVAPAPSAS